MRGQLSSRLTYANVMATIAVFIGLGGSATAAVLITGKNVKDGSLTGADVKNNTIRSVDVRDGDLLAKDFRPGQLPAGAKGDTGARGPAGATGATGPAGGANRTVLFATVAQDGTLVHGQGITGVTKAAGAGVYHVRFERSVLPSQCAATATSGSVDGSGGNNAITAVVPMGPFDASGASDDLIDVYERTMNGSVTFVDAPFHIIVAC